MKARKHDCTQKQTYCGDVRINTEAGYWFHQVLSVQIVALGDN